MGLLTDPNTGQGKFTKLLIEKGVKLCFLIYLAGITWFLWLPHKSISNATYFSENALLPGLVRGEFDEDVYATNLHVELQEVMSRYPSSIPYDWLEQKFSEMYIDTYLHNFTLTDPLSQHITYKGQNLYAILRASRSASTESVVVTAPFRPPNSVSPDTSVSVALMLAVAKFTRRHKYWAKDIVFLITDHEQLGTQAWLEAYHGVQSGSGVLNAGHVVGRAGSIQAAINLEFHSTTISHVDVKIEGLNGQLPNLDLVNLVHRLCSKEGIRHTFKNRTNPRKKDTPYAQWLHSLTTLSRMVLTQASGVPNGNHGLFHRFGIEAVSLEGHEPSPDQKAQVSGLYQAGRVLEGILRSLNNLLERFHQSYFFYLLPGNDRFVSIGLYTPAVGLIGAPLLIKALTLWLQIYANIKSLKYKKTPEVESDKSSLQFSRIGTVLLLTHVLGLCCVKFGPYLTQFGHDFDLFSVKNSICIGFFLFFELSLMVPQFTVLSRLECDVLNIIALLELATVLLTIAMHNFSLSLILATIFVPIIMLIQPKKCVKSRLLQSVPLLLISPYVLIHLTVLAYTYYTHGLGDGLMPLLWKSWSGSLHAFIYLITDSMIYGNWMIDALFGCLLPNWIVFWTVVHS